MSFRNLIIIFLTIISVMSCNINTDNKEKKEPEGFVAKVEPSMTFTQVAKANSIGEPFLRTKLGIPQNIGKTYTVEQMAKRYDFAIDDLKKIIEDRKAKQVISKRNRDKAKKKTN